MRLRLEKAKLPLIELKRFIFSDESQNHIEFSNEVLEAVKASHQQLQQRLTLDLPIYGVSTGFGASCKKIIPAQHLPKLQKNLISYLACGTGAYLGEEVGRSVLLCRLLSLARGYSGVRHELLQFLAGLYEKGVSPVIPSEGSLGASGDLVPLAYLGQLVCGQGQAYYAGKIRKTAELFLELGIEAYELAPKEGLALVNGTSTMAASSLYNTTHARHLIELSLILSAWNCLLLEASTEAYADLVNRAAKPFKGQIQTADLLIKILKQQDYQAPSLDPIGGRELLNRAVQAPYSVRCVPQILGPVWESLSLAEEWTEQEINSTSDNPLIDAEGNFAMGGNFYGGYIAHAMDYLKISLGHVADMLDRQLLLLMDEKTNRGLPPNLADWPGLPEEERHLHHGLKGLHQLVSAVTSEIMQKSIPGSIFSRSSESHNQDKVSLGMSASVQCAQLIDSLYNLIGCVLVCSVQALDLKQVQVRGEPAAALYRLVRTHVPYVKIDQALDAPIAALVKELKKQALSPEGLFTHRSSQV